MTTFAPEKLAAAEESLQRAVRALQDLDVSAQALEGTEIPVKLLEWVDQGGDPDAFFQQLFRQSVWAAQVSGNLVSLTPPHVACVWSTWWLISTTHTSRGARRCLHQCAVCLSTRTVVLRTLAVSTHPHMLADDERQAARAVGGKRRTEVGSAQPGTRHGYALLWRRGAGQVTRVYQPGAYCTILGRAPVLCTVKS